MSISKMSPVVVRGRELDRDALPLRAEGNSFREIAEKLDVSVSTAHKAVERGLALVVEEIREEADSLRAGQLEEIRAVKRAIWADVLDGDLAAIDRAVKLWEREARLAGLDVARSSDESMPQITIFTGLPGDRPAAAFPAMLAREARVLEAIDGEAEDLDADA